MINKLKKYFYHTATTSLAEILLDIIKQLKPPPASILDVTYGQGYTTRLLRKYDITSIDVDADSKALIKADMREPEKIREIQGKTFDVIYCDPPYIQLQAYNAIKILDQYV